MAPDADRFRRIMLPEHLDRAPRGPESLQRLPECSRRDHIARLIGLAETGRIAPDAPRAPSLGQRRERSIFHLEPMGPGCLHVHPVLFSALRPGRSVPSAPAQKPIAPSA